MEGCRRIVTKPHWLSFNRITYELLDNLEQLCVTLVLVFSFSIACAPGDCKKIASTLAYGYDTGTPLASTRRSHSTTSSSPEVQHFWEYPSQEMVMKERLSNPSENKRNRSMNVTNISLDGFTPSTSNKEMAVSANGNEHSHSTKEKQDFYRVRRGDPEDYFRYVNELDEIRCDSIMGDNLDCIQSETARNLNDLLEMGPIRFSQYIQIVDNPEANHDTNFQKRAAGHGLESHLWSAVDRFLESRMLKVTVPELFGLIPGFVTLARIHNGRIEISFEAIDDSHFEGRGHKKKKKKHKKKKPMQEYMQQHQKTMLTILVVKAGMMMKAMMMGAVMVAKKALLLSMMAFLLSSTALKKAKKGDANRRYTEIVSEHFYHEPYVYYKNPGHFPPVLPSVPLHYGFQPMVTQRPIGYRKVITDGEQTDWQPIDNPNAGIA